MVQEMEENESSCYFDIASYAGTSEDGIQTPTTDAELMLQKVFSVQSDVPHAGNIYKIHLRGTNLLITLEKGQIRLQTPQNGKPGGGWFWMCVEKDGWFGFQNWVSGTYLGRDSKDVLVSNQFHHKDWESFSVRHDPRGGYTILVKHCWGTLRKVSLDENRRLISDNLREPDEDGAQWDFEKV